jgi:hypothetical protein
MATKRRAPKPGGLDPAVVDRLIEAVKMPLPDRWAALYAGVSPDTFKNLLEQGILSDRDPECVRLAREVYRAKAKDIGDTFQNLRTLATQGGTAEAGEAFLRLMHPADFGGKIRTEPDEFQGAERHRQRRENLLDNPPPRMRAELRKHRWVQLPEKLSAKERAVIDAIIAKHLAPVLPEKAGD